MHKSTPLSHYAFTEVYKPSPMSYTAPDMNHDSSTNALSAASEKRDEPLTMPWRLASNRTTIKIDIGCATCVNCFPDDACSTKFCHMKANRLELMYSKLQLVPVRSKKYMERFSYHKPHVSLCTLGSQRDIRKAIGKHAANVICTKAK